MQIALMFQRHDVDAFLDELTHEEYLEWCAFAALQPQGWNAQQIAIQRLSFITAQVASSKKLKEKSFAIDLVGPAPLSPKQQKLKDEVSTIRMQIAAEMARKKRERGL